jgi:hypothetical protein
MKLSRSALGRVWSRPSWFRAVVTATGAILALGIVSWVVVRWAPTHLASTSGLTRNDRAADVGRVRTALLAVIAGFLAAIGAVYTGRTFALNRQGQITDRFTRAVDQLGDARIDVRLGGIYALERIARESREDHGPIVEILTAYVREHAPWPQRSLPPIVEAQDPSHAEHMSETPPTDVQAVLTVLGRRRRSHDNRTSMDLSRTNLAGADLSWASLDNANLTGARLERSNLIGTTLREAYLQRAHLQAADLIGARLDQAQLVEAHLEGADLSNARLTDADLTGAYVEGTVLLGANLERASLVGLHCDDNTKWPRGVDPRTQG